MYGLDVDDSSLTHEDITMRAVREAVDRHANQDSRRTVRFKSLVTHEDPIETISEVESRFENAELSIYDHHDHYQIDLHRRIKRSDIEGGARSVDGSFALFQNQESDVWTALTGANPDFYKRGLLWLFKRSQPTISNFYTNSDDLENVLDNLHMSLSLDTRIEATKAVAYSHRHEGNISFETHPYYQVFNIADESNRYVDKISFRVQQDTGSVFGGFMSRDGQTKFESGDASVYFNNFLPAYTSKGQEKADIFADKERSSETGEVNEIEIEFDQQVFRTPDDNRTLIHALSNISQSSVTVYHKNPYAHVSVLDYVDGSSCDVFVTESDTISLIPSYRGSMNSLMRISDQISREFQEGSVREQQQPEAEFADFFSN